MHFGFEVVNPFSKENGASRVRLESTPIVSAKSHRAIVFEAVRLTHPGGQRNPYSFTLRWSWTRDTPMIRAAFEMLP